VELSFLSVHQVLNSRLFFSCLTRARLGVVCSEGAEGLSSSKSGVRGRFMMWFRMLQRLLTNLVVSPNFVFWCPRTFLPTLVHDLIGISMSPKLVLPKLARSWNLEFEGLLLPILFFSPSASYLFRIPQPPPCRKTSLFLSSTNLRPVRWRA